MSSLFQEQKTFGAEVSTIKRPMQEQKSFVAEVSTEVGDLCRIHCITAKTAHLDGIKKLVVDSVENNKGMKSSSKKEKSVGFIEPRKNEHGDIRVGKNDVNTDDYVSDSTSSTSSTPIITSINYRGIENERENILKEKLQHQTEQKNNLINKPVKTDKTGNVNHVNDKEDGVATTTVSYEADEVTKASKVKADKVTHRKNVENNLNTLEKEQYKSVHPINDEKQKIEIDKTEIIEMKNEVSDTPVVNSLNVQKDSHVLLDILGKEQQFLKVQSDVKANKFPDNEQIHENALKHEPELKTEQSGKLSIKLPESKVNTMVQRDTRKEMPSEANVGPEEEKKQVEMLARKYSGTLNETDLPRQRDTYTQRLRNKLVQTGRYDLIENKNCKKRLPTCLIIGVMKAGTEAFSTFLGVHPQVAMQFGYAAMVFFSSDQFENGYEWYKERMMCSTKDQVTMEKSPQYFSSPVAPKRIHDMDPKMKLIILVRDPVSRALSHFLQQKSSNPDRLKAPTFEECVYNKKTKTVISDSHYVMQSTYSVILKRWLQYFPYKQILIIDGDTFKKNPTRSLSKTESFLGIDHSISKDRLYFNKEKGFYCLRINSTLPEDLDMSCFGSEKGRPHPAIEPEVENALLKYFQPYNEEFMKITGMKMRWSK
ncbi:uncharacterized protein LOC123564321 [Mercenaria mercenaria]|uniref:uncharacterized protein LOC123564321 n=1 Tax=Mercenaria mercenaria TaxID=6596 RepID=UPI00234F9E3C|nr:uncharacterized protein LOC123564321 [Mercenaria mercenaria]